MKLGIIGTGMIVQEFLPAICSIEGIEIVVIMNSHGNIDKANEVAKKFKIDNTTTDFEELCSFDIDTIYVATPNHLHAKFAKMGLEAGKNVIVEKPFTTTLKDALEIKEIADKKGLFAFEAITTQYLPAYQSIKQNLQKIGQILSIDCSFHQKSSRYDKFKKGVLSPVFDAKCQGGALMDLNCYNLSFVIGLLGEPYEATYMPKIEKDIDVEGVAILNYDDAVAMCGASKAEDGLRTCRIVGQNGMITCSDTASVIGDVFLTCKGEKTKRIYKQTNSKPNSRAIYEFKAINKAIRTQDIEFYNNKLNTTLDVTKVLDEISTY